MPCDDIGEVITVVLDSDERLRYFLYEKITCGKIVPLSGRLNDLCRGKSASEIDALRPDDIVGALGIEDDETAFLADKELDALQSALANYRGSADLDPARYRIESIEHAPDSTTIRQVILVPKPDTRIPSCRTIYGPKA
jgi:hypothetical protein